MRIILPPVAALLCLCALTLSEAPCAAQLQPIRIGSSVASGATKAFLRLEGVEGGTQAAGHEGWIEVMDWGFGVTADVSAAGAIRRGAPTVQKLMIRKRVDRSSPKLFDLCVKNGRIPDGELQMVLNDGESYTISFQRASVVSASRELGSDADLSTELVGIVAEEYTLRYQTQSSGAVEASWDAGRG